MDENINKVNISHVSYEKAPLYGNMPFSLVPAK